MILLAAVAAGLIAGWGWARWHGRSYQAPVLRSTWLILAGFVPQLIVAYWPVTRFLRPTWLETISLSASLVPFLAFVWINRELPGMPVLLAGMLLNLTVIAANGGWMPISPETASRVLGKDVTQYIAVGGRFGQKDILMLAKDMRFSFLADRFLLPAWSPYQAAFSAGDVIIATGAFWLLARAPEKDIRVQAE